MPRLTRRNFADSASPWEQVGSGDPTSRPEVCITFSIHVESLN